MATNKSKASPSASGLVGKTILTRNSKRIGTKSENDPEFEYLLGVINDLKNLVVTLCEDNIIIKNDLASLKADLNELVVKNKSGNSVQKSLSNEIKNMLKKDSRKHLSYADTVKTDCEPDIMFVPKKDQKPADTKNDLKNTISPTKINVESIRNGYKGSIIVKCKDKQSSELLISSAHHKMSNAYEVKTPKTKHAQLKVINLSEQLTDDNIVLKIKKQNSYIPQEADIKIIKQINMKKLPSTDDNFTVILECDSKTSCDIINNEILSIGWDRCRVFEYTYVLRCFKCLGFNHTSKVCTKDQTCAKCSGNHMQKDCTSNEIKCVNCTLAVSKLNISLDVHHQANSMECSVLQRRIENEKKRVQLSHK